MAVFCRLGWHRWVDTGGRLVCPRCRAAAVAARPRLVRILLWLLAAAAAISLVRAVVALTVRPGVEAIAADWSTLDAETRNAIFEARDVLGYSVVAGFVLAVVLVPVLVALRGPVSGARWAAFAVICTSLMGQVLYISSDLAGAPLRLGVVPGWYPLTQQMIETLLLVVSAAAPVLLTLGSTREYFEEGMVDADAGEDATSRALAAVRRRRAAQQ